MSDSAEGPSDPKLELRIVYPHNSCQFPRGILSYARLLEMKLPIEIYAITVHTCHWLISSLRPRNVLRKHLLSFTVAGHWCLVRHCFSVVFPAIPKLFPLTENRFMLNPSCSVYTMSIAVPRVAQVARVGPISNPQFFASGR